MVVPDEEIVKGYEYAKGHHVLIDPKGCRGARAWQSWCLGGLASMRPGRVKPC